MLKSFINTILSKFGFKVVKEANWRPRNNFERLNVPFEIRESVLKNSMLNEARLVNIVLTSEYLIDNNIDGDFIECGVWKGGSVALMAYYLKFKNDLRCLRLFDSFDDICQPDSKFDGDKAVREAGGLKFANGELTPVKGIYSYKGGSGNETEVRSLMVDRIGYPANLVMIYKGWFQNTLPENKNDIKKIALLRLDGDWYASTKVCLEFLYEKVVVGGIIIVDDYGCYEGCKKAVDEFLVSMGIKPYLIKVDDECIFWIKY